jgi:hypothetical protein
MADTIPIAAFWNVIPLICIGGVQRSVEEQSVGLF